MRDRSARTRVGRRVAGGTLLTTVVMVVAPFGAAAAPDDDDGMAGGAAAAVDVLSNVDTIDLDLLGFTGDVVAPPRNGTASSDEGLDVVYGDSEFAAATVEVMATRQDAGLVANATVGATGLTLLGQQLVSVGSSSSSVDCPTSGQATATAEVTDVDLGSGPISLGANEFIEAAVPFESDAFTPGTATAHLTAETGAIVVDGAAEAVGLLVTVVVDGEPAGSGSGVVEGAIDGFLVLAASYCVPPGFLPDTGSDLTVIALWAGVLLLTGGALLQLWARRSSFA